MNAPEEFVSMTLCDAKMEPLYRGINEIKQTLNTIAIGVFLTLAGAIISLIVN